MATQKKDLNLKEAAAAFRCSEKLVRTMIEVKALHAYRVGNRLRIPASEIDRVKSAPAVIGKQ